MILGATQHARPTAATGLPKPNVWRVAYDELGVFSPTNANGGHCNAKATSTRPHRCSSTIMVFISLYTADNPHGHRKQRGIWAASFGLA